MKLTGKPLCPGVALGPVHVLPGQGEAQTQTAAGTAEEELERLEQGRKRALDRVERQRLAARERLGEEAAEIFRLHALMLEDRDFLEAARSAVRAGRDASEGVRVARESFAAAFRALDDPYLRERAVDVEEVSRLWREALSGETEQLELAKAAILWAEELSPGQLIALEREKVLGLVVERMAADSHAAILARAMALPTAVGLAPRGDWEGAFAALDGETGELYLAPEEAALALGEGAEGVGLFRTEFLCLSRDSCPGEEEQYRLYRRALEAMEGRRVVIRTLDIGGDKMPPWLEPGRGENPALGLRGIRLSLRRPELFCAQLRAILRAAPYGKAALMFPLISSVKEVRQARAVLEQCRRELEEEGLPAGEVEVGAMIETPAAALMAGKLAREVDFFSIGTNDLTQYTLAMDRQDPDLAGMYDSHHPAVLELIRRTVEEGHRHGRRVALCGQLGADREMTRLLLEMGVDELSVPVGEVLGLKAHVSTLSLTE